MFNKNKSKSSCIDVMQFAKKKIPFQYILTKKFFRKTIYNKILYVLLINVLNTYN